MTDLQTAPPVTTPPTVLVETAGVAEADDRIRFSLPRRLSRTHVRFLGLFTLVAAEVGGAVPHSPAAGCLVALVALADTVQESFRSEP
ncbi:MULTISPECIES: hypothetical protein [Streptomyces]|uniref:Uncharacterized protein n=1 Tax=Streptomyces galilaeus TaxID=33899 RepID=A0ABW9IMC1_STRGJ